MPCGLLQSGVGQCATLQRVGREARLIVEDDGVGISVGERAKVLRRFYRLDRSRGTPGSGLGLSLVAAIVELHGGGVALDDAEPGLRVTLTIPLMAADD